MIDIFTSAGFADVALTHRYDCFDGTTKAPTARRYRVQGVNVSAVRIRGNHG
jgi:hypothetical protein